MSLFPFSLLCRKFLPVLSTETLLWLISNRHVSSLFSSDERQLPTVDVARLCRSGRSTDGPASPAAEGAAAVGGKPASGRRHPESFQGHGGVPLHPPGPGPRFGLASPTGEPAAQVMRQTELHRAGRTEESLYPQSVSLSKIKAALFFQRVDASLNAA